MSTSSDPSVAAKAPSTLASLLAAVLLVSSLVGLLMIGLYLFKGKHAYSQAWSTLVRLVDTALDD